MKKINKILTGTLLSAISLTSISCSTTTKVLAKNIDKSMAEFVSTINTMDYVDTAIDTSEKIGKLIETSAFVPFEKDDVEFFASRPKQKNAITMTGNIISFFNDNTSETDIENTITRPSERVGDFSLFILSDVPFITFSSDDNDKNFTFNVKYSTDKIEDFSEEIDEKINKLILKRSILMVYLEEVYRGNVNLSNENKIAINAYVNVLKENTSYLKGNRGMVKNQLSLANDLVQTESNDNLINYYIIKSGEALETRANKLDSSISAIDSIITILENNLVETSSFYNSKLSEYYENLMSNLDNVSSPSSINENSTNKEIADFVADSLNFSKDTLKIENSNNNSTNEITNDTKQQETDANQTTENNKNTDTNNSETINNNDSNTNDVINNEKNSSDVNDNENNANDVNNNENNSSDVNDNENNANDVNNNENNSSDVNDNEDNSKMSNVNFNNQTQNNNNLRGTYTTNNDENNNSTNKILRNNNASESISQNKASESISQNKASESISQNKVNESISQNKVNENISQNKANKNNTEAIKSTIAPGDSIAKRKQRNTNQINNNQTNSNQTNNNQTNNNQTNNNQTNNNQTNNNQTNTNQTNNNQTNNQNLTQNNGYSNTTGNTNKFSPENNFNKEGRYRKIPQKTTNTDNNSTNQTEKNLEKREYTSSNGKNSKLYTLSRNIGYKPECFNSENVATRVPYKSSNNYKVK